jgi:excisionase family DNA binding protein
MKPKCPSKIPLDQKFALSIAEASELTGACRDELYKAVSSKQLIARKRGRATLILPDDLRAWLNGLPEFTPGAPTNNNPRSYQSRAAEAGALASAADGNEAATTAPRREAAAKPRLVPAE